MKNKSMWVSLFLGLCVSSSVAMADGFHYKIDTSARLKANAAGELVAVGLNWVYDADVSSALLEDDDLSAEHRAATLQARAGDIINDLRGLGYFTQLSVDGQALAVGDVTEYGMDLSADERIKLSFLLPLQQPLDVKGKQLSLAVADPDGVASMLYSDPNQLSLDPELAAHCQQPALKQQNVTLENGHTPIVQTATISCQ